MPKKQQTCRPANQGPRARSLRKETPASLARNEPPQCQGWGRGGQEKGRGKGEDERRDDERVRINAEKWASLKLISWNLKSFAPSASDVDVLFAHEEIDLIFLCEAKQRRPARVTVKQLDFDGYVTYMTSHVQKSGNRQSISTSIAFFSKRPGLVCR